MNLIKRLYEERQLTDYEAVLKHKNGKEIYVIENITLAWTKKRRRYD